MWKNAKERATSMGLCLKIGKRLRRSGPGSRVGITHYLPEVVDLAQFIQLFCPPSVPRRKKLESVEPIASRALRIFPPALCLLPGTISHRINVHPSY